MTAATPGYTLVLCAARCCGVGSGGTVAARAAAEIGESVRASRHGVLVRSGCLLGPATCRLRPAAPVALVQACDVDRRPLGAVVRVGPLRTVADVAALRDWLDRGVLDGGVLDPGLLPAHLLVLHRQVCAAHAN